MVFRLLLASLMFFCGPAFAQEQRLTVDLAEDHVDITTGFNGAKLVLYGVKARDGHVAVVIRGPDKNLTVRRKENVLGAWMNRTSVHYRDVPGFYDYALDTEEGTFLFPETRKEYGIGLQALRFTPEDSKVSEADKKLFQDALLRNKQTDGLFPVEARNIEALGDDFFKTEFYVPSNVPTGQYVIETFLFSGDKILDKRVTNLKVAQTGFSAGVDKFASDYAFAYALLTVAFAMLAGWLSNFVRHRK